MSTTRVRSHINAPRQRVYSALIDPEIVQQWRVPPGMRSEIHSFQAREGGFFRISLTYDDPSKAGKSASHTDTYHGYFARLVPNEQVVEVLEFETTDPSIQGEMRITVSLRDAQAGGTDLLAVHEGLPPGVRPSDNERGWTESLEKLAAFVERRDSST